MQNLAIAFGDMPEAERRKLAIRVFEHFGIVTMDFLCTERRTPEEVVSSTTEEGYCHIEQALADGKGVFALSAHFGSWERMAHYMAARAAPLIVVARDADDPALNERVVRLRQAAGMTVLSRGSAVRGMLAGLRQNRAVGILPDQNSGDCFAPFFGKPAGTALGPAVLHLRSRAPIVPCFCARVGVGRYRWFARPPLEQPSNAEDPAYALTVEINRAIEEVVREYPEQWLWFHDRWKSARVRGLL